MDQKTVRELEKELEETITQVLEVRMGLRKLPLMPNRHTTHLMAKAAVTVYEAAVENDGPARQA